MNIQELLQKKPICYVTWDIERALGLSLHTPGYFIITNATSFAKKVAAGHSNVLLIESAELLTTSELLAHEQSVSFIKKHSCSVLVFKNNKHKEHLCTQHGLRLCMPKAQLADSIEQKLGQSQLLDGVVPMVPSEIRVVEDLQWKGEPFVLQYNVGHTGNGTLLLDSADKLKEIQMQFPKREVRVSQFIDGPTFAGNAVVAEDALLVGSMQYQITGHSPFTTNHFATVGNDWGVTTRFVDQSIQDRYDELVIAIGEKLQSLGWRGAFGVDCILDPDTSTLYVVEINARQSASVVYESELQRNSTGEGLTTFEAHVLALLGISLQGKTLIPVTYGSQLVMRIVDEQNIPDAMLLEKQLDDEPVSVMIYPENHIKDLEILRIKTNESVMSDHNQFSSLGKQIIAQLQKVL